MRSTGKFYVIPYKQFLKTRFLVAAETSAKSGLLEHGFPSLPESASGLNGPFAFSLQVFFFPQSLISSLH